MGIGSPDVGRLPTRPSPSGSKETMPSPGAATSTHGPARLNFDGLPCASTEPTVNTQSSYQDGLTTTFTPSQSGLPGRAGSVPGFCSGHCPAPPTLPAAATTTTFL